MKYEKNVYLDQRVIFSNSIRIEHKNRNGKQQKIAEDSKAELIQSTVLPNIATQILPAKVFYPAEDYHQHYSDKNPTAYDAYRSACKRDSTLKR